MFWRFAHVDTVDERRWNSGQSPNRVLKKRSRSSRDRIDHCDLGRQANARFADAVLEVYDAWGHSARPANKPGKPGATGPGGAKARQARDTLFHPTRRFVSFPFLGRSFDDARAEVFSFSEAQRYISWWQKDIYISRIPFARQARPAAARGAGQRVRRVENFRIFRNSVYNLRSPKNASFFLSRRSMYGAL